MATSSFGNTLILDNEAAMRLVKVLKSPPKVVKLPKDNPYKVSKEEFFKKVKY